MNANNTIRDGAQSADLDQRLGEAQSIAESTDELITLLALERIAVHVRTCTPLVRYLELDWDTGGLGCGGYRDQSGVPVDCEVEDEVDPDWVRAITNPHRCALIHGDSEHGPFVIDIEQIPMPTTAIDLVDLVVAGLLAGERQCVIARRLRISPAKVHRLKWKAISLGKLAYPGGPDMNASRVMRLLCAELPALLGTGWPPIEVHAIGRDRIVLGPRHGHKVYITVTDAVGTDPAAPVAA